MTPAVAIRIGQENPFRLRIVNTLSPDASTLFVVNRSALVLEFLLAGVKNIVRARTESAVAWLNGRKSFRHNDVLMGPRPFLVA
jgi:hypothetical protein